LNPNNSIRKRRRRWKRWWRRRRRKRRRRMIRGRRNFDASNSKRLHNETSTEQFTKIRFEFFYVDRDKLKQKKKEVQDMKKWYGEPILCSLEKK